MCKFIRTKFQCGHVMLGSTPSCTLLCSSAKRFNLEQGIDRAPASCFPLAEDIDDKRKILCENLDLGHCDDCCEDDDWNGTDSFEELGTGQYTSDDVEDLRQLRKELEMVWLNHVQMAERYKASRHLQAKLPMLGHAWLEEQLTTGGAAKYEYLLLSHLIEAQDWVKRLEMFVENDHPVPEYRKTFKLVVDKYRTASEQEQLFKQLIIDLGCFEPETGLYRERVCLSADKLRELLGGHHSPRHDVAYLQDELRDPSPHHTENRVRSPWDVIMKSASCESESSDSWSFHSTASFCSP